MIEIVEIGHEEIVEAAIIIFRRLARRDAGRDRADGGVVVGVEEEDQGVALARRIDDAMRRGDEAVIGQPVEDLPGIDDQSALDEADIEPVAARCHDLQPRHRGYWAAG